MPSPCCTECLKVSLFISLLATGASQPQVICTNTSPAVLGEDVILTCEFQAHLDVLQVTWQKKRGKDTQNMATYSEKYGSNIAKPFERHVSILNASSRIFTIKLSKLEKEDEACYVCLFNVYPNGAFTGEVCLTDFQLANEVLCNAKGNDLKVSLDPQEIQTRHTKKDIREVVGITLRGRYSDTHINPTCTFQLQKETRKRWSPQEGLNNPDEEADEVVTGCSASGTEMPKITWDYKGHPVIQEDKVKRTRDKITVTSTLTHIISSLPADQRIICSITHSPTPNPTKTGMSPKKNGMSGANTGDTEIHEQRDQRSWVWQLKIPSLVLLMVTAVLILIYRKAWRNTEPATPKKLDKAETGQVTPTRLIPRPVRVRDGPGTPVRSLHDYRPVTPSSYFERVEVTPLDKTNSKETPDSSLKKRKKEHMSGTSSRRLDF